MIRNTIFTHISVVPKYNIQPFEKKLAMMELSGLLDDKKIQSMPFPSKKISLDGNINGGLLWRRLAYWQGIGNTTFQPTLQVQLEECEIKNNEKSISCGVDHDDQLKISNWVELDNPIESKLHKIEFKPQTRRILRYGPHDLHEYRGKFFPQLVKSLVNYAAVPDGGTVIDPMCGSGTTVCESHAMGMNSIGLDTNPLSVEITRVKTAILHENSQSLLRSFKDLRECLHNPTLDNHIENRWDEKDILYLKKWFDIRALYEIHTLLNILESNFNPGIADFYKVCLSNIIRGISWQKVSDLRVRKEYSPYELGKATESFLIHVKKQLNKVIPYIELVQNNVYLGEYLVERGDARDLCQIFPSVVGKCDVMVTSPPYAMALPYIDTDRLSLFMLGMLHKREQKYLEYKLIGNREITEKQRLTLWNEYLDKKSKLPLDICNLIDFIAEKYHVDSVGFRRKNLPALLAKYYLDMLTVMENSRKMLKPGAFGFFVVGNNSTIIDEKRVEIPTNHFLGEIAETCGWKYDSCVNMELLQSRDIFRNNRGTEETILILRN